MRPPQRWWTKQVGLAAAVVLLPPMLLVLHWGVVRRERYLEAKFGEQYPVVPSAGAAVGVTSEGLRTRGGRITDVRRARPEDAPALAALSAQLGYPVPGSILAERLERILDRTDEIVLVACGPDEMVIGWAHGAEQRFLEADLRCELFGLVVDQGHRRQGVGEQLVAAVERWAHGRGVTEISVRSNVVRPESHPFYERLGYQRKKTQHVYRKPLDRDT